jgi:hypothetical protein
MSLIPDIPHYYLPLSLIFSNTGAKIVKRFVLTTTMRVISKDIFKYLNALRLHLPAYANLLCIWDERSEPPYEMRVFRSNGDSLANARKGTIAALDVMVDIYQQDRVEVRFSKPLELGLQNTKKHEFFFLSHADRGRAQDDVGLMGETDLRSSVQKGTVN